MKNIIQHILETTDLKQKDLAAMLKVSAAQVSKWKKGEYIPYGRLEELRQFAQLPGNYELIRLAGTEESIEFWKVWICESALPELDQGLDYFDYEGEVEPNLERLLQLFERLGIEGPYHAPREIGLVDQDSDPACTNEKLMDLTMVILNNLSLLKYWFSNFICMRNHCDYDDPILEIEVDIEAELLNVTLLHLDQAKFDFLDVKILEELNRNTFRTVFDLLGEYHMQLAIKNLPVFTDLYRLLKQFPETLDDEAMFFHYAPGSDKYQNQSTKVMTAMLTDLRETVGKLERKVDALLFKHA
jgi:transcriptional regulator with XRE-family HTH domain